jgi:3-hydroxyacyl-CoA dehydrogenase
MVILVLECRFVKRRSCKLTDIACCSCCVLQGPLTLADFIGLDTCLSIMQVLHRELGDSKYRPAPLLQQYVDAGCKQTTIITAPIHSHLC